MTTQYVEHKRKKYFVKEPTIQMWSEIMRLKNLLDEQELNILLLEKVTGMPKEIIKEAKAKDIAKIGGELYTLLNLENKQVFQQIEHKGKKYQLFNVNKMTFGQFIDIDTFLSKDEGYRISNLSELASYMYNEVIDGKVVEYGDIDFKKQTEEFKDLPIKYVEGAVFFLLTLGRGLQALIQIYFQNPNQYWTMIVKARLGAIGDGISRFANLPKTKYGRLIAWLLSPLFFASTILLTCLILIGRKLKGLKNLIKND